MANVTTNPLAPAEGGLNYAEYQAKIQQAAAKTRQVAGTEIPKYVSKLVTKTPKSERGTAQYAQGMTALTQYQQQGAEKKAQAEKAATALEMAGESTLKGLQNIEAIQASVRQKGTSSSDTWASAAEKADEYVKAARSRVGAVLSKVDEINDSIGRDRDFSKAHAMQSSVQAALGSIKSEERNIAETYGTASKEFAQFQQSKMTTLATVQSNIHATYQQLAEEQHKTYLNAVSDVYTKSNMYVGFQEQQHVEMLKYSSQAKNEFALQEAQFQVGVEQLKMAGMENLANWMIETPTFSMDMTPLVTLLGELGFGRRTSPAQYHAVSIVSPGGIKGIEMVPGPGPAAPIGAY